ncbi:Accessory gene regulator B [Pseudobutyrivibrio sp. NOR37]|uniref:Accessory regulator AgrB n=2 Tax=Pseudobutyrivibrio TaxID=46205 RepID=A0A2G3ECV0_9FIRM|nr:MULTISPECIES: accessory gene regulator B family protein [Pseudobutyrivibrio]NEX01973.1 accessory regulator AgrB [Pseudobutyrivibrio xylanivorans]PHU41037.1 accessory regulator AgrB [Pseudobutyrivibrio ruminis]SFR73189.1 Accessory gene regulator B [Pseudobutyrivibrio sp. NOR37]
MEKLAIKLTDYLLSKDTISEEDYDIYLYGFTCFLEISISFITCFIIGIFLGMFFECILFFCIFMPLRSLAGGLHLNKFIHCYLMSCLILTGSLLLVKYFSVPDYISLIGCILLPIILFIIGPINHPNRPVTEEENSIFKNKTNIYLVLCILLSIILYLTKTSRYLFLEFITFAVLIISSLIPKLFPQVHKQ